MALKLLPSHVRRMVTLQEALPLSLRCHASPSHGAPGLLMPGVGMAPSVDIGPGIHRVVEETAQRVPCRAAPDQLAFGGTRDEPIRQLDPVVDTIAQDAADRGLACELLENELDHRLRLLVGILDDITGETPEIAMGALHAELPPLRFGSFTRQHPLFEDMPFRFRHRSLEA